ncbi:MULTISPECIES: YciI family protein [unclassified Fusibacter]|uniref:YciI family protein n=1 Tax=unclassified Fusibacter TaxID=2624464 RepID=UPI001010781C|nr:MULTISPECIES: YciI family protein [unclassified Fusibacter]MCK8058225.1 YciI family protein [Fusibacter sp. A2]NPE20808.1 hypothetical protein [Fusibacter sp. A1]RXV63012.1 hypothetical protein DWB64_03165 [Fusibacter sp. A1]
MKKTYVILLEDTEKQLNRDVIARHVSHLKGFDSEGMLIICGPFEDYRGGMIILNCNSLEEAHMLAKKDPFVSEGYRSYSVRTLEVADKSNNFLG